jgi:ferritin-like metal-binding protein YciE
MAQHLASSASGAEKYSLRLGTKLISADFYFWIFLKSYVVAEKNLEHLFLDTLKDIYYAERKLLTALPKMAKAAQAPELKGAIERHFQQTEIHIQRLAEVFAILGEKPVGKTCPAIDGILEEGTEVLEAFKDTSASDAGLIAAAQAVEHYEIARYGTLKRWAQCLDLGVAVNLLDATLKEEGQTNTDLSSLADQIANPRARIAAE